MHLVGFLRPDHPYESLRRQMQLRCYKRSSQPILTHIIRFPIFHSIIRFVVEMLEYLRLVLRVGADPLAMESSKLAPTR